MITPLKKGFIMERIQNLLTKDNAYHLAASLGSGLVGARYLPISIKEAACISLITGAATAIGRAYLEGNTSKVKIVAVTLASIAATFFHCNPSHQYGACCHSHPTINLSVNCLQYHW